MTFAGFYSVEYEKSKVQTYYGCDLCAKEA